MDYLDTITPRYIELLYTNAIRQVVRLELIDQSEKSIIGEISGDLSSSGSGVITMNYQQGVRMSCNLSLINVDGTLNPSYETGRFWINTKFRLFVGIEDDINNDVYWFSQGVYYTSNPININTLSSKTVNIIGVDKFGILGPELGYNQLIGTHLIEAGQPIYKIFRDTLMLPIGNGNVIDSVEPFFDAIYKDVVMPYTLKKAPGEYMSTILIELANILGSNIYYDKTGRLNVRSGTTDMSYSQDAPIWDYTDVLPEYYGSTLSFNYTNVINSMTVVGSNVDGIVCSWTAENHNPFSPTRIEYIGRKEAVIIDSPMAYSEQRAKEYAEYMLKRKSILQEGITIQSMPIPHLDVDRVINITDQHYGYQQQRFIIQSITLPLGVTGQASIVASNIATLPYYELQVAPSSV